MNYKASTILFYGRYVNDTYKKMSRHFFLKL